MDGKEFRLLSCVSSPLVVNLDCQLDGIWGHLGSAPLSVYGYGHF